MDGLWTIYRHTVSASCTLNMICCVVQCELNLLLKFQCCLKQRNGKMFFLSWVLESNVHCGNLMFTVTDDLFRHELQKSPCCPGGFVDLFRDWIRVPLHHRLHEVFKMPQSPGLPFSDPIIIVQVVTVTCNCPDTIPPRVPFKFKHVLPNDHHLKPCKTSSSKIRFEILSNNTRSRIIY